ncbi:mog1/psbp alpha/beta/alpha sandwich [Lucifera butyrica]|uniref:Mog1/psbp alpha/beta/alpha sandwich n=1 Tax=Lucifera butyrica TaxID=1351585 RepID=A0A498R1J9_9FIRM|nr:DcrB-related protein [Lucifera butyrica]VBB05314.1 mog1/psbp alpha/beta/alpha sandwich [Lucifera butyrica]
MKKIQFWKVVLLGVFLCGSMVGDVSAKTYRQYDHGLMFDLPDNWECTQESAGQMLAVFVDPAMRYEINTLTLVHQQLPERYSFREYVDHTVDSESKMLWMYQLQEKQFVDGANTPYYRLTFTWRLSWEQKLFAMQMLFFRHSEVYILTATAPADQTDSYRNVFQQIFRSLTLVD